MSSSHKNKVSPGYKLNFQLLKKQASTDHIICKDEFLPNVFLFLTLPSHPMVLGLFTMVFITLCILAVWQTYIILENFNLNFTLQYSPFYLSELYLTISMLLSFLSYKVYMPLITSFKTNFLWDISIASKKLQKKFLRECKYLELCYVLELFFAACALWINLYVWACDHSKYFMVSGVIIENFPAFSPYFHWVVIGFASLACITMIAPIWYTLYMVYYLRIQILMLTEKIECVKQQLDKRNTLDVIYDKEFQSSVTKCLKFFIRRHQEIIKANNILQTKGNNLNFLFVLGGILLVLYGVFTIYSNLFNWIISTISIFGFFLLVVVTAVIGQQFEDLSENLAEAVYSLQWNLWDNQNMKLFLIFHQYTSCRIITLPFPSYVTCNLSLIKAFAKLMFSVANFFQTMKQQRH